MAERAAGYTHADWKADMASVRKVFADQLGPALEQMLAALQRLDAGRTQLAMVRTALARVTDLGTQADVILTDVGYRYGPVNEAQTAAGGLTEVYGEKHAHQMG